MTTSLFTPESGKAEPVKLIPAGTLANVNVGCKISRSKEHGGIRYDLELTVLTGPYKGWKIFDMFACPLDKRNDKPLKDDGTPNPEPAKWRTMSIQGITRLLEAAGIFKPTEPETYGMFNDLLPADREPTEEEVTSAAGKIGHELGGCIAAIKVKIEPEQNGHPPKNKVGEWLSSNPNSGGYKLYQQLQQETQAKTDAARPAAFGGVVAAATAAPVAAPVQAAGGPPAWLKQAQSEAAAVDPLLDTKTT
jgi:hypothetical protein